jgi:rod shape determining protein RodA
MSRNNKTFKQIDWLSIGIYLLLVSIGWLSILSASWDSSTESLLETGTRQAKQLFWIGASFILITLVFLINSKFFSAFAYLLYALSILSLIAVLVIGKEVNGAKAWFELGPIKFQPAEFAKIFTSLAIAQVLTSYQYNIKKFSHLSIAFFIIFFPIALIILQNDTGSALVFLSLILVLFREGLNPTYLLIGVFALVFFILSLIISPGWIIIGLLIALLILYWLNNQNNKAFLSGLLIPSILIAGLKLLNNIGLIQISFIWTVSISITISLLMFLPIMIHKRNRNALVLSAILFGTIIYLNSVNFLYNTMLEPHQKERIEHTLGLSNDPLGAGYNVNQSKIAIGSGGFWGKGFLQGTQTKFDFVPEQSTDFIFCTVGEEFGFIGTSIVILLFTFLIIRIIILSERQRSRFSRIYGYSVATIIFFHVAVNIGMTTGLMPVIGIPLPFFSYGGSSFMAFSLFIFIFLRLDSNRLEIFR